MLLTVLSVLIIIACASFWAFSYTSSIPSILHYTSQFQHFGRTNGSQFSSVN